MEEARRTIRKLLSRSSKHGDSLDQGTGCRDEKSEYVLCTLEVEFMWTAKGLHVKNEDKEVSRKTKTELPYEPATLGYILKKNKLKIQIQKDAPRCS